MGLETIEKALKEARQTDRWLRVLIAEINQVKVNDLVEVDKEVVKAAIMDIRALHEEVADEAPADDEELDELEEAVYEELESKEEEESEEEPSEEEPEEEPEEEEEVKETALVVFDLETTGVSTETDRIVQFAAIKLDKNLEEVGRLELMMNPGVLIPKGASDVHGITNKMVRQLHGFPTFAPQIVNFLGDYALCGHNVLRYDIPLLQAELKRHNFDEINMDGRSVIDTLGLSRRYKKKAPHTLIASLSHFCGRTHIDAHDALGDVLATADILEAMMTKKELTLEDVIAITTAECEDVEFLIKNENVWKFGRGKYKGTRLATIAKSNPGYLRWILDNDFPPKVRTLVQNALDRAQ